VGVREATSTHYLNAMDAHGLIIRARDAANRRIHLVELTEAGEATFLRLQQAAVAFDARLRAAGWAIPTWTPSATCSVG
jgi:MarR family transcriptional regulator, transcriptional regulator for hemolysin